MRRHGAILVLDTDRNIAELISAVLGDKGYVVRTTLDSKPVRAARIAQPPALIVLDLALPAKKVATVCDYARSFYPPNVPSIITTTSLSIAADLVRGDSACLMKPFALDDLLACVAPYLHLPHGKPANVQPQATTQRFGFACHYDEARV